SCRSASSRPPSRCWHASPDPKSPETNEPPHPSQSSERAPTPARAPAHRGRLHGPRCSKTGAAVGIPEEVVAQMRHAPFRAGMEAIAHTLAYDHGGVSRQLAMTAHFLPVPKVGRRGNATGNGTTRGPIG